MDTGEIIELLIRALPYPDQMKNIKVGTSSVEFDWRGASYRVDGTGSIYEIQGGCQVGSNLAMLIRRCVELARTAA